MTLATLLLAELIGGQFMPVNFLRTMPEKSGDYQPAKLFSTSCDMLLAYQSTNHSLHAWDMKSRLKVNELTCPDLFNMSVSADGKYFTGLEKQDGDESKTVHCYELPSLKHHSISLAEPVADFVIGKDGCAYTTQNETKYDKLGLSYSGVTPLGHINGLLPKPEKSTQSRLSFLLFKSKPKDISPPFSSQTYRP